MDNMILIDIETQSFNVESGIYEVACLVVENYNIVDSLYLGIPIENYTGVKKYGYGFHNISKTKSEINKFRNLLTNYNYPLVAHNCPFDKKFLDFYEWLDVERDFYCSMRAIRLKEKGMRSYSLGSLISHYNLGAEADHEAFQDVSKLYQLLDIIRPDTWYKVGQQIQKQYSSKKTPRTREELESQYTVSYTLAGEIICFTGKSRFIRSDMQEIAIINGAKISNNIQSSTTMLVVGEDAGSKLDKAQEKEIIIISDDEFMEMVGDNIIS